VSLTPKPAPPSRRCRLHARRAAAAGRARGQAQHQREPVPPSPRVIDAIRRIDPDRLRRYPSPTQRISAKPQRACTGFADMIVAGNGSDEIWPWPCAHTWGRRHSRYPIHLLALPGTGRNWRGQGGDRALGAGWDLPIDALLATGARAIFFANPTRPLARWCHQPGARIGQALLRPALGRRGLRGFRRREQPEPGARVLQRDDLPHLEQGLWSGRLRFGYAIAAPAVVSAMNKVKDSYNCDAVP